MCVFSLDSSVGAGVYPTVPRVQLTSIHRASKRVRPPFDGDKLASTFFSEEVKILLYHLAFIFNLTFLLSKSMIISFIEC